MASKAYTQPSEPKDLNAPYFSLQEVAFLLKVSVKTVRRRINEDGYPHSRSNGDSGTIRVSRKDLDYYYEAGRVHPTPIRRPRRAKRPQAQKPQATLAA